MTAVSRRDGDVVDWAAVDTKHASRASRFRSTFESALFSCFALDDRWTGLRWFGGHGGGDRSPSSLTTAHGDEPGDRDAPEIRVKTRAVRQQLEHERFFAVRELLEWRWDETGEMSDAVRRAAFPYERTITDPTEPWNDVRLPIDDGSAAFRFLGDDSCWVAIGEEEGLIVSVEARRWPLPSTGLVTVTDFQPYFDGAIEVHRRMTRRR